MSADIRTNNNVVCVYLQRRDALADWLRVLSEDALFIQEAAVPPTAGRLEKAVVEHVFQAGVQRAQDPLLGNPNRRIRVEAQAFLFGRRGAGGGQGGRGMSSL